MKRIITSFGFDTHQRLLKLSIPSFYQYAYQHGYDLFIPNKSYFTSDLKNRHFSWWKLELIQKLFDKYDQILWIDADMIACDCSIDIFNEFDDTSHVGMVVHETGDGSVPNCGLWLLDKKCLSWLPDLCNYNHFACSDGWWEQAAMLHKLGINPDIRPIQLPNQYDIPWTKLDYRWNPHVNDHRRIPSDLRFFHSTMIHPKEELTKKILQAYGHYI